MPGTMFEGENALLDLREIVGGVAVQLQLQLPYLNERVVPVRPDLRQIERVVRDVFRVPLGHHLHEQRPARKLVLLNRAEQNLLRRFASLADHLICLGIRPMANALLGLEVEFHPEALGSCIDEAVRMRAESVHVAHRLRQASVGEPNRHWWGLCGDSDQKSHMAVGERRFVCGWRFCV